MRRRWGIGWSVAAGIGLTLGHAATWHVHPEGDDAADGLSWSQALRTVTNAMGRASAGDQVWVAAGVYSNTATSDTTLSLVLKNDVGLYGGFTNGMVDFEARDPVAHPTVLSGDIAGGARSKYVVWANGVSNAVLDGFIITRGSSPDYGAAIYALTCDSLMLQNCVISNNYSANVSVLIVQADRCLRISNCVITANFAGGYAGFYTWSPDFQMVNSTIVGNSSVGYGGGGIHYGGGVFRNCVFRGNSAGANGGAVVLLNNGSPIFENCTFAGNAASGAGGAIYLFNQGVTTPIITNCILYANTASSGAQLFDAQSGDRFAVAYSCVQGGWMGTGNLNENPLFASSTDVHLQSRAGRWTPSGRVRDLQMSPCIDAGDPAAPLGFEPYPHGHRLNMGAYGGSAEASLSLSTDGVVILIQ